MTNQLSISTIDAELISTPSAIDLNQSEFSNEDQLIFAWLGEKAPERLI